MDERSFVESKKQSWEAFGAALDRVRSSGAKSLTRDELRSLGTQYRTLVSDLSFARTQGASDGLVTYLNELAGRAHGVVYASRPARLSGVKLFLLAEFPALFRRTVNYTLIAAMIFFIGWAASATSPEIRDAAFSQQMTPPPKGEKHASWASEIDQSFLSSFIVTNNIREGILAFAGGATVGLFTVYQMAKNGLVIGAVCAKAAPVLGQARFWSLMAPHGVIELMAIFICGGAGLMIAASIIAPGNLRRADSIRITAGSALKLFAGAVLFFVIAGIIEGFITPADVPERFKLAFGGLTAVALVFYLGFAGRARRRVL